MPGPIDQWAKQSEKAEDLRRLKPYPSYKDSGVEWLGEIPAHWDTQRLKTVASVELSNVDKKTLEGQEPVRLCNYTDVYYHNRITPDLNFMAGDAYTGASFLAARRGRPNN